MIVRGEIVISGRNPFNPSSITSHTFLSGQGGNLEIQANRLIITNDGTLSVSSLGTGRAGNIHVNDSLPGINEENSVLIGFSYFGQRVW